MSDQMEQIIEKIKTPSTWLRILFMLGFCVILYLVGMVIMILTVAQALFSIFTGTDNENLRRLGAALADYVSQLLRFITYNSEVRPFPFAPFPEVESTEHELEDSVTKSTMNSEAESADGRFAGSQRRPRTRKKTSGSTDKTEPGTGGE